MDLTYSGEAAPAKPKALKVRELEKEILYLELYVLEEVENKTIKRREKSV